MPEKQQEILHRIKIKYKFPNCIGFVDGFYLQIIRPKNNTCDFFNRKTHDKLEFIDIHAGFTGKAHDVCVFM